MIRNRNNEKPISETNKKRKKRQDGRGNSGSDETEEPLDNTIYEMDESPCRIIAYDKLLNPDGWGYDVFKELKRIYTICWNNLGDSDSTLTIATSPWNGGTPSINHLNDTEDNTAAIKNNAGMGFILPPAICGSLGGGSKHRSL